jgi:hypothetical protein
MYCMYQEYILYPMRIVELFMYLYALSPIGYTYCVYLYFVPSPVLFFSKHTFVFAPVKDAKRYQVESYHVILWAPITMRHRVS